METTATTRTRADTSARLWCWIVRIVLEFGLLLGLVVDLSQLEGKGWLARSIFYSLVLLVLPMTWRLARRRFTYSYLADTLLVAPFLLDIWGNIFGLYDSVDQFDDVLHFINWMLLAGSFSVSVVRTSNLSKLNVVALGTGFGATMIVLWEFVEFLVMKLGTERLFLTYEDTIADLMLSTSGGFLGTLLMVLSLRRRTQPTRSESGQDVRPT